MHRGQSKFRVRHKIKVKHHRVVRFFVVVDRWKGKDLRLRLFVLA